MTENILSYCPGCGHGTVHRILAEIIDEEGLQSETIGISPVGCSVLLYNFLDIDWQEAAHGRAPALATAVKRLLPDKFVFTYQGDGDAALELQKQSTCNRGKYPDDFHKQRIHGTIGTDGSDNTLA
jgi:2-oxoglutarate ferredoxin oxidoreductase subunit beta